LLDRPGRQHPAHPLLRAALVRPSWAAARVHQPVGQSSRDRSGASRLVFHTVLAERSGSPQRRPVMISFPRAHVVPALRSCVLAAGLAVAALLGASLPAGASAPARAGTDSGNLVVNPGGTTGATSAQGWDEVTIPGWQVAAGLPTVVRYGTPGFARSSGSWP